MGDDTRQAALRVGGRDLCIVPGMRIPWRRFLRTTPGQPARSVAHADTRAVASGDTPSTSVAGVERTLVFALVAAMLAAAAGAQTPPVNPTAAVIAAFTKRVQEYADLRKSLESPEAKPTQTREPQEIAAARTRLAEKIAARRAEAKPGDIFTSETRAVFVRLLNPALRGSEGAENKRAIRDDNPGKFPLGVNAPYPKLAPLSIVPPDVLAALPKLPDDVEYRFVGSHLILYDARAGLVIDYLANAVQKAAP